MSCGPHTARTGVTVAVNLPHDAHLGTGIVTWRLDLGAARWLDVDPKLAGDSLPWEEGRQVMGVGGSVTTRLGCSRRAMTWEWHGKWASTGGQQRRVEQA